MKCIATSNKGTSNKKLLVAKVHRYVVASNNMHRYSLAVSFRGSSTPFTPQRPCLQRTVSNGVTVQVTSQVTEKDGSIRTCADHLHVGVTNGSPYNT